MNQINNCCFVRVYLLLTMALEKEVVNDEETCQIELITQSCLDE